MPAQNRLVMPVGVDGSVFLGHGATSILFGLKATAGRFIVRNIRLIM
jgi:hypothetical protein